MKTSSHFKYFFAALLAFAIALAVSHAQDTNAAAAPVAESQDSLRAYLQVQDQLHKLQVQVERNQADAQDIAARNVQALGDRLSLMEQTNNRFILAITISLAALGIVVIIFAFLQWRAMHRFAETAMGYQVQQSLVGVRASAIVDATEPRLISVIERLEKRILELETNTRLSLPAAEARGNGKENGGATPGVIVYPQLPAADPAPSGQFGLLLNKAHSLVSLGQYEAAVSAYDQALALEPANTEALIKKGAALEKIAKLDEAIACYDRAIAADRTVTLAYLYKGGVFNRLEKYSEALECYEQALKTQEHKAHAA